MYIRIIIVYTGRTGMALSVRSPAVEYLARQLAEQTGSTMTDTIQKALEDMKQSLDASAGTIKERLTTIVTHCAALPDLDSRTVDEILGYNENGVTEQ
jgi:antitoxin VapB